MYCWLLELWGDPMLTGVKTIRYVPTTTLNPNTMAYGYWTMFEKIMLLETAVVRGMGHG